MKRASPAPQESEGYKAREGSGARWGPWDHKASAVLRARRGQRDLWGPRVQEAYRARRGSVDPWAWKGPGDPSEKRVPWARWALGGPREPKGTKAIPV